MKKVRELHLLETSQGLWQEITINIIGPLPRSNNKDIIVVIVDQFTKMIKLKAIITVVLLEEIAKIYRDNIWKIQSFKKDSLQQKTLICLIIHGRLK